MEKTYEIADIDGRNRRKVTLAQFLAENETKKAAAMVKFRTNASRDGLKIAGHFSR